MVRLLRRHKLAWNGGFAERFEKPIVKGSISSVDVYFAETETVISPVDIKLSIMNDKDGLPDQEIASKSLSTTALNQNPTEWVATTFEFDQPINVDDVFYIVVSGFPNRTDESTYETDNVVIGAVRRNTDSKRPTSTYHLLAEEDENFEPTGEYKWYKNEDENVSLMITPYFTYEKDPNSIEGLDAEDAFKPLVSVVGGRLKVNGLDGSFSVDIYDLTGRIVKSYRNAQDAVGMPAAKGSYVVLLSQGNKKWSYKILY
ncbi:MAG: T9SS type A sorting domain-containing protein [Dysgonomonas sp.]